ncbi:MAG: cation diffusion facilitator family transporter, partial [Acidimicrobiales bacterium]
MSAPSGHREQVRRVALVSLAAAIGLVVLKLAAGAASHSLSLLSEAAHSGLDAGAAALTYFAVTIAARPPDTEHPYGHGKAENISALVQSVALIVLAFAIVREAVQRLAGEGPRANATWYAFAVTLISIAVDAGRARTLRRIGRRHRSPALEADAAAFSADVLTSLGVLLGLALVKVGFAA